MVYNYEINIIRETQRVSIIGKYGHTKSRLDVNYYNETHYFERPTSFFTVRGILRRI